MFGWLTVEENVLVALEWRGGGGGLVGDLARVPDPPRRERERRRQSDEVLELCGLGDVRSQPAGKLPIGRARMVEMARAIVDEPQLPAARRADVRASRSRSARASGSRCRRVCHERGCAVLLVEHDVGFVMEHCDSIVVLNLGEIIAVGSPDEVRDDAAVQEAYLG